MGFLTEGGRRPTYSLNQDRRDEENFFAHRLRFRVKRTTHEFSDSHCLKKIVCVCVLFSLNLKKRKTNHAPRKETFFDIKKACAI